LVVAESQLRAVSLLVQVSVGEMIRTFGLVDVFFTQAWMLPVVVVAKVLVIKIDSRDPVRKAPAISRKLLRLGSFSVIAFLIRGFLMIVNKRPAF
jgi:hypothetical protein